MWEYCWISELSPLCQKHWIKCWPKTWSDWEDLFILQNKTKSKSKQIYLAKKRCSKSKTTFQPPAVAIAIHSSQNAMWDHSHQPDRWHRSPNIDNIDCLVGLLLWCRIGNNKWDYGQSNHRSSLHRCICNHNHSKHSLPFWVILTRSCQPANWLHSSCLFVCLFARGLKLHQ